MTITTTHNLLDRILYVYRKGNKQQLSRLDSLRQEFRVIPVSSMIYLLTLENREEDRIVAIYMLMTEDFDPQFRQSFVRALLLMTPTDLVLRIFLLLKKNRVNKAFATRTILRYLWEHPCLTNLATLRPGILRDIFQHALGRNTFRGAALRFLKSSDDMEAFKIVTGGFTPNIQTVQTVLNIIFRKGTLHEVAPKVKPEYRRSHELLRANMICAIPPVKTVTVTTRGDISATLVRMYHGSDELSLTKYVEECVDKVVQRIPKTSKRVALVLDLSASTKGSGEREFACISQSLAFSMVLERVCELTVFRVGGHSNPNLNTSIPYPEGETDLASAFLDALNSEPDKIVIVSDGYENSLGGDLDFVLQSVPERYASIDTMFVHSMFTQKDSLKKRRPSTLLPELKFWHENDFANVCSVLFQTDSTTEETSQNDEEAKEQMEFLNLLLAKVQN
ncbi:MAG: hypothetical protein PHQ75_14965 [Thermoguttaceae bacterium]|nr:hypothetical protein [Thermoguttaceae bacterium]